jgi:hypothetical protein
MTWESKSQEVTPVGSVLGCTLAFSMFSFDFKNPARTPRTARRTLHSLATFAVSTD